MEKKLALETQPASSPEETDPKKSVTFCNEKGEIDAWDDYWEDMLRISRGPRGWNVGNCCG